MTSVAAPRRAGPGATFKKGTRKGRGKAADNVQRLSKETARALTELQPYSVNCELNQCRERVRVWLGDTRRLHNNNIKMRYRDPTTRKLTTVTTGTKDVLEAERLAKELEARLRTVAQQLATAKGPRTEADYFVFPGAQRAFASAPWELYYHFKKILRGAGLPHDSRSMFHRLRRTHATHLYLAGGAPTSSLCHESEKMTRDCYLDPRFTQKAHPSDLLRDGIFRRMSRGIRHMMKAVGII